MTDRAGTTLAEATLDDLMAELRRRFDGMCVALRDADAKVVQLIGRVEALSAPEQAAASPDQPHSPEPEDR